MYEWWWYNVVEPWVYGEWMMRAVTISVLVSVSCALLGVWMYVRRLSMMGDALSHIVVPGIAIGFWATGGRESGAMLLGAAVVGVIASFLIQWVSRATRTKEDASIGVVFTAMFALGVILINTVAANVHLDPDCVLFGNVLGVPDHAIMLMGGICACVIVAVLLAYRLLLVSSFDPAFAASIGLPVVAIHYGMMGLLSVTSVASFEAVGAVLVVALLITPAATAHLLTDSMPRMLVISVVHAVVSSFLGIYAAIWFDTNPAGAMVLVGTTMYVLALLLQPTRGVLVRWLRRRATPRSAELAT